jgi:UDP-3-O-[3-hydroxymyristoyl] glucosamine N-acyltransferase
MPSLTLGQLLQITGAELRGDADCLIHSVAPLDQAVFGQLAFLHRPEFRCYLANTQASVVILSPEELPGYAGNALVSVDPLLAYARAATALSKSEQPLVYRHSSAVIDSSAQIASGVTVGANAVIGARTVIADQVVIGPNCTIGDDCVLGQGTILHPNVTLYHSVVLGADCIIHAGAVLGSDGFGFANDRGSWVKIPQLGGVKLGNQVEVGANTTIDRGALNDTVVADGVKLDNQVHVGHNVQIGEDTAIAACAGIAGSTRIGKQCTLAGASGLLGHLELADRVHVSAMTVVTHNLSQPGRYTSLLPAVPHAKWRKNFARIGQLDRMAHRLRQLEKKLAQIIS